MEHQSTYRLSSETSLEVIAFIQSLPRYSQEHLPDWHLYADKQAHYHLFYDSGELVGLTTVLETRGKLARIQFGPLAISTEIWIKSIEVLSNYYKKCGFWSLYIQSGDQKLPVLPHLSSAISKFDKRSWSTIWVDLSIKDLISSFSKHHRRMIKKAQAYGLEARSVREDELADFNEGYCAMYKQRGIQLDEIQQLKMLQNRYNILVNNGMGMVYGAYENNGLIGGVIVAINGESCFYVQGFASVNHRHLPVSHYVFYELFIFAQIQGFRYFDLGGYNRFAHQQDQVYQINQFKRGFSENIVDYAPQIEIIFKPFYSSLLALFLRIKYIF